MAPRQTTRRFAAFAVGVLVLIPACTREGEGGNDGTGATGPTIEPAESPTPVLSGPPSTGTYEYVNEGLRVVIAIDGNAGSMEIHNETAHDLGRPDFYILDARDGTEIEGEVVGSQPVPAGGEATFDVAFDGIEVRNIGAIALLFGPDNYGLFVRTA